MPRKFESPRDLVRAYLRQVEKTETLTAALNEAIAERARLEPEMASFLSHHPAGVAHQGKVVKLSLNDAVFVADAPTDAYLIDWPAPVEAEGPAGKADYPRVAADPVDADARGFTPAEAVAAVDDEVA